MNYERNEPMTKLIQVSKNIYLDPAKVVAVYKASDTGAVRITTIGGEIVTEIQCLDSVMSVLFPLQEYKTFEGWVAVGRCVNKGEKAQFIEGKAAFTKAQTSPGAYRPNNDNSGRSSRYDEIDQRNMEFEDRTVDSDVPF